MTQGTTTSVRAAALAASLLLAAACGADGQEEGIPLPSEAGHVHGILADPEDGSLLLGTHYGVFQLTDPEGGFELVGPVMDYMGFASDGERLLASGHPGPDMDLPDPVGLLESTDGGHTWTPLSRTGESDFHALAATTDLVIGFDGALRATEDGQQWHDLDVETSVISLAMSGETVLAATARGLLRSTDSGHALASVAGAPPLVLLAWAEGTAAVYGVDGQGNVHRSGDAGLTWEERGSLGALPQALYADAEQVVAATDTELVASTDEGRTFGAPSTGR